MNPLSKASRDLVRNVRTNATNIPWMIWSSIRTVLNAASYIYERIRTKRTKTTNTNQLKAKLNMTEKRHAFYSRLLNTHGELTLSEEEAKEWRRDLPKAIETQHLLIDSGALPSVMSIQNVRALNRRGRKTFG